MDIFWGTLADFWVKMTHQWASRGSKWRSKTSSRKQIENRRVTAGHGGGVARARLRGGVLQTPTLEDSVLVPKRLTSRSDGPDPDACGNPATVPCIDLSINVSIEPCMDLNWNPMFLLCFFINNSYLLGLILVQFVVLGWPWDAFGARLGP